MDKNNLQPYKILIADDEKQVHLITQMVLKHFTYEDHPLELIHAYSAAEAIECMQKYQGDIAVIFLDVIMENVTSGLEVVEFIRKTQNNKLTRIILRTGQPGEAPEEKIIREYDIDDYRLKTELTAQRTFTSLYTAIRSYEGIRKLNSYQKGLERIIHVSSEIFQKNTMEEFHAAMLSSLMHFYKEQTSSLTNGLEKDGFVYIAGGEKHSLIAGSGKYKKCLGKPAEDVLSLKDMLDRIKACLMMQEDICSMDGGFIITCKGNDGTRSHIFIEDDINRYDVEMIRVFLSNYSLAMDNFRLTRLVSTTQEQIIGTLGDIIESQFEDTAWHVHRVADIMSLLYRKQGKSSRACESIRYASMMHDVGKITVPENILKKPGKLTSEEFEKVKEHTVAGYNILKKTSLALLEKAADIAYYHHEKYDGSGYPCGLKADTIPIEARMMAVVDVFDALINKRCYKDAWTITDALAFLEEQKGKHFDPEIVDLFMTCVDEIGVICKKYN